MATSSYPGKDPFVPFSEAPDLTTARVEQTTDQLHQEQLGRTLEALSQSEQRHAFLLQLSDTLRPLAEPQRILDEAARVLGQFLGANRVGYAQTQEDAHLVAVTRNFTRDVPSIEGVYRYRDYGPQLLAEMQRGQTVIRPDIANDPTLTEAEKQAHADLQLGATLNVPLVKQGRLVAILFVHYQQAHNFSAHEVALAQETAERTWAYVEQARSEIALHQTQQQLSAIIHQATAGIVRTDPDGTFTFVNEQYAQQLGYDSAELLGRRMQDLTHPDDLADNLVLFDRLAQQGEPFVIEKRYIRKDGSWLWVRNHVSALRNPAGEMTQLMAISVDITARKQAEEALRQADRCKDEFLAMLAHELRNPMAVIRSGLHILSITGGKDETSSSTIAMMNRQSNHLVHMVDDLLDISRINRGKIELNTERLDLVELVRQTVASHQASFQEQSKSLHMQLPPASIELKGDETRLSQVVSNMITNGLRYTGENGHVWVTLEHQGQEAIIQVRDNGIGLSSDQLSSIFELFVQVDNSLARAKGGLGLGLTLVKRLVEQHGGCVEAHSEGLGMGSTFRVHLPTLTTAALPISAPNAAETGSAKGERILVVDDNADASSTLTMLLKLKGYDAYSRTSGRSGIKAAESLLPSVIVLDLGMPELDGYATCRLIREQAWGQNLLIIALTGYGQSEDIQRAVDAGFDGHLTKPVDLANLVSLMTDLRPKERNR